MYTPRTFLLASALLTAVMTLGSCSHSPGKDTQIFQTSGRHSVSAYNVGTSAHGSGTTEGSMSAYGTGPMPAGTSGRTIARPKVAANDISPTRTTSTVPPLRR